MSDFPLYNVSEEGIVTCMGTMLPSIGAPEETKMIMDYNCKETIIFQMTGSVSPTFDFPVTFSRTGKNVVMQWDSFIEGVNVSDSKLFTGDTIPERFLPPYYNGRSWPKHIIDGESSSDVFVGALSFGELGNIIFEPANFGNFNNSLCGAFGSSICYTV